MNTAKISPKFQIVIPREVRERAGLKAGTTMEVIGYAGRVELIPIGPMKKMKGFLKGIDTTIEREDDRV